MIYSIDTYPASNQTLPAGPWNKTNLPIDMSGKIRIHNFYVNVPAAYPAGEDGTEFVIASLPATPGRLLLHISRIFGYAVATGTGDAQTAATIDLGSVDIGWMPHKSIKRPNFVYAQNLEGFLTDTVLAQATGVLTMDAAAKMTHVIDAGHPLFSPYQGFEYDTAVPLQVTLTTGNPVPVNGFLMGQLLYVTAQ